MQLTTMHERQYAWFHLFKCLAACQVKREWVVVLVHDPKQRLEKPDAILLNVLGGLEVPIQFPNGATSDLETYDQT